MSLLGSLGGIVGGLLGGGGGGGDSVGSGSLIGGPGQHTDTNYAQNTSTNYATSNTNSGATYQTVLQGGSGPVTLTDQGTVAQSFNFATDALEKAASSFANTQDALQSAYQQSLTFVGKTTTPADEASQQRSAWLTFGVLAAAVAFVYFGSKK